VSLRDYRSGDSPRRIHWKAWARTGRPVVKEYADEFFVRHALLLDTFPSGVATHFEAAVSAAASLVMMPRSGESLLDLMFVEDRAYTLTRGRGLGATTDLLRVLATVEPSTGKFETLAEAAVLGASRMSPCASVSGRVSASSGPGARRTRRSASALLSKGTMPRSSRACSRCS